MIILLATLSIFALVMTAMAVGVIFGNRPLKGSCRGSSAVERGDLPDCVCGGDSDGCRLAGEGVQKLLEVRGGPKRMPGIG